MFIEYIRKYDPYNYILNKLNHMVDVVEIPMKEEYIPELSILLGREYIVISFFVNWLKGK